MNPEGQNSIAERHRAILTLQENCRTAGHILVASVQIANELAAQNQTGAYAQTVAALHLARAAEAITKAMVHIDHLSRQT